MGTMLQAADPTLDDFQGLEGCNEILNVTRPDVVRCVHDAYFEVGVDCVETNTFGANFANLGEYDIADRIYELAEAGARIARESADAWSTAGPAALGARLGRARAPSCRRSATRRSPRLRDAYQRAGRGMVDGGVDAVLVETAQDLLQAKAAVIGAKRALRRRRRGRCRCSSRSPSRRPARCCSAAEIGAALTALEPLGIDADRAQLRHRPGRDERAPAPPRRRHARIAGHLHAQRRPARSSTRTARTTR